MTFIDRLIRTIGDLPFQEDQKHDLAHGALAILAAALAKLPETERELYLDEVEAGDLREAVKQFEKVHRAESGRVN